MTVRRLLAFTLTGLTPLALAQSPSAQAPAPLPRVTPVTAAHAMVVTIHHDATDAGVEVLKAGGNAVDAAVAVGFALAVVLPAAGNIGGGGFMLVRPAASRGVKRLGDGKPHFIDFREEAPAAASRDMYLDAHGNVIPKLSTVGVMASGVPGTVAGLVYAEQHFGRFGLKRVMQPAIRLAKDGWVLTAPEAAMLHAPLLTQFPVSHRIFQRDGDFYKTGDTFRQPELAKTLERIAASPDDFYHGAMAAEIAAFEKQTGGDITAADLAAYQVKDREPLVGRYKDLEIITSPPPSSGGVALLQTLEMLNSFSLAHLPYPSPVASAAAVNGALTTDRSAAQVHYITEAFRRAYMDRADYLGDPDFNTIPVAQLIAPAYADAWARGIQPVAPTPSAQLQRPAGFVPSPPSPAPDRHESPQTTHFSVVDADGNAVAMTYTLNFGFGSGVTVDKLGFLLNDEMDDFASKLGVPNGFGLIQGPANSIAPRHRPLSSMTPTIVAEPPVCHTVKSPPGIPTRIGIPAPCDPGAVRYVLGSPGGSTIITTVANDLISMVDNGLDVQAAADAPRFHHQYLPDVLEFEKRFPHTVVDALKATGNTVKIDGEFDVHSPGEWGDSELIARDLKTGLLSGGQDKRHTYGKAAGY